MCMCIVYVYVLFLLDCCIFNVLTFNYYLLFLLPISILVALLFYSNSIIPIEIEVRHFPDFYMPFKNHGMHFETRFRFFLIP